MTAVHDAARVAFASLTSFAEVAVYTAALCPHCHKRVMTIPGSPHVEVRPAHGWHADRGRVVECRCRRLVEIVEHPANG